MKWIDFCKDYAKKHGITYREALKKAGSSYREMKASGTCCSSEEKTSKAKSKTKSKPKPKPKPKSTTLYVPTGVLHTPEEISMETEHIQRGRF